MYNKISEYIVKEFCEEGYISEEKRDTYKYCFEITISTFLSILIILLLSLLFRMFIASLIFLMTFIICRMMFGGYHANTYLACFILTMMNYLFFVLITKTSVIGKSEDIIRLLDTISLVPIGFFSPLENKFNPLSVKKKKRLKILSIISTVFLLIIIELLKRNFVIVLGLSTGLLSATGALIIGTIKSKNERRQNKWKKGFSEYYLYLFRLRQQ